MTGFGDSLARSATQQRRGMSDVTEGQCESVDFTARLATVNIGGGRQVMPIAGPAPWPGDRVQVGYLGQKPVCLGIVPKAPLGTVQAAPDALKVDVRGDDQIVYRYAYDASLTLADGDRVLMDHTGQIVVCVISSEPQIEVPPSPPPVGGGGIREATFFPTDSGNFRGGQFMGPEFEVSENRSAYYWYGPQIRDTMTGWRQLLEARIYLNQEWDQVPGTSSRLGVHGDGHQVGEPGLTGELNFSGGTRWLPLLHFADDLAAGTSVGVGLYAGFGWRRYSSRAASGQIFMRWTV